MSEYYNVTTNAGDAAIATAIANNTKLNITHVAFGDGGGSVPTPNKTRSTLVNEVHRQAVTKYSKHPTIANYIVIETIIPAIIGGFWIRELGIIADNILISHGSHAPFYKVKDTEGVGEYRLKFTQDIRDGSVAEITLDESLIYASQAWVSENYIPRIDLVDNLTTADSTKPLTAAQGKKLQDNKLESASLNYTRAISSTSGENANIDSATGIFANTTVGTAQYSTNPNAWWNIVNVRHRNGTGNGTSFGGQLVFGMNSDQNTLKFRAFHEGIFQQWNTVWTDQTFDPTTKLNKSGGTVSGDLKINGSLDVGKTMHVSGLTDFAPKGQDAYYSWNKSSGLGRTDFINNKGGGVGGFEFWNGSDSGYTSIAILDSNGNFSANSATADKLKTSRKINNVDFNGTADITIKDDTKLPLTGGTLTGGLNITTENAYRMSNGNTGMFFRYDASNTLYLMQTNVGDPLGNWNDVRPLVVTSAGICSINGNAASSTKLQISRKINNVDFDGSKDITITDDTKEPTLGYTPVRQGSGKGQQTNIVSIGWTSSALAVQVDDTNFDTTWPINIRDNAGTATKLKTARNIAITGAVSGNADFDGSGNISIATTANNAIQAFANYNTQSSAFRKSSGISSITNAGSGLFLVTLSNEAPDANYIVQATCSSNRGDATSAVIDDSFTPTTTQFRLRCRFGGDNTAGSFNPLFLNIAVIY